MSGPDTSEVTAGVANLRVRRKKNQTSLNHLLNFQSYTQSDQYKSQRKPKPRSYSGTTKTPLTGMAFINLNYKFVVDCQGNYKPQELDPNLPVSRQDIVRIIAPSGNACPICLTHEFVAPRMLTACGHIICLKCLISLLDTEVPTSQKRESVAVVEKYRECPLCFSVIRAREVKPVLVQEFDERFETPKVNDQLVMTLMTRPHHRLFAVPRAIEDVHYQIDQIPYVDQTEPDLSKFSRLFKADLAYIKNMYAVEKAQILAEFEAEKALYGDDGVFVHKALDSIDAELQAWTEKYQTGAGPGSSDYATFDQSLSSANTYFYYEAGFNASATYVLAPLDIKVLKSNYSDDYSQFPSSIVVKVENIQYEELTQDSSLKKYKYLSHMPIGTTIAFLQCNWYKSEFISRDTWNQFHEDLTRRSKKTSKKFKREERDKVRAQDEEERRSKQFFERENNQFYGQSEQQQYYETGNVGSLTVIDNRSLPSLAPEPEPEPAGDHTTTIWGTRVPKSEQALQEETDSQEMIRKAKEEMYRQEQQNPNNKARKKKKKLILLSSSSLG